MGESVYQFRALFRPVDGSSGVHPHHGPGLLDHASPRVLDPPVPRRLAGPSFHLSGDCAGEGLPPLDLSSAGDSCESPQELFGSESDSGLSRHDDHDIFFERFPDSTRSRSCRFFSRTFYLTAFVRCRFGVSCWASCPQCQRWFREPGFVCGRFSFASMLQVLSFWKGIRSPRTIVACQIFGGGPKSPVCRQVFHSARIAPTCSCFWMPQTQVGGISIFDQPLGVSCGSLCHSRVSSFTAGLFGGSVFRQHHSSGVPPEARWHSLFYSECGGSVDSPPLRVQPRSTPSPVHFESVECTGGFSEPQVSGPRLRVDLVFGGFSAASSLLAGHH